MKKLQQLRESAKYFKLLNPQIVGTLKTITESTVVDFQNIEMYEAYQILVKEGFVEKNYRHYKLSKKGAALLEAYSKKQENPKKFKELIKEHKEGTFISIKYKKHDFKTNVINESVSTFVLESDGLPIVKVSEEAYANLIHRTRGQHWKKYLGEDVRQLIRQKKISKFYVEDDNTGRRYLYIIP